MSRSAIRSRPRGGCAFTFTCNGITVNGNEHPDLDGNGLIDRIEVACRPLPSAVLFLEVFGNKLGFEATRLVPAPVA